MNLFFTIALIYGGSVFSSLEICKYNSLVSIFLLCIKLKDFIVKGGFIEGVLKNVWSQGSKGRDLNGTRDWGIVVFVEVKII